MFTLGRHFRRARVVRNGLQTSQSFITISRHTINTLPNTLTLVVHVAKVFTTSHPTMLIFAPHTELHSPLQLIENDLPLKPQMHHLWKEARNQLILSLQPPQITLNLRLLLILDEKLIQFLSRRTLFPVVKKTWLKQTNPEQIQPLQPFTRPV